MGAMPDRRSSLWAAAAQLVAADATAASGPERAAVDDLAARLVSAGLAIRVRRLCLASHAVGLASRPLSGFLRAGLPFGGAAILANAFLTALEDGAAPIDAARRTALRAPRLEVTSLAADPAAVAAATGSWAAALAEAEADRSWEVVLAAAPDRPAHPMSQDRLTALARVLWPALRSGGRTARCVPAGVGAALGTSVTGIWPVPAPLGPKALGVALGFWDESGPCDFAAALHAAPLVLARGGPGRAAPG